MTMLWPRSEDQECENSAVLIFSAGTVLYCTTLYCAGCRVSVSTVAGCCILSPAPLLPSPVTAGNMLSVSSIQHPLSSHGAGCCIIVTNMSRAPGHRVQPTGSHAHRLGPAQRSFCSMLKGSFFHIRAKTTTNDNEDLAKA